ncbi:MAG: hypothetical protein IJR83_04460 [Clostridia bacterium]|nr:hypothetical protein [Clostridia bacterium]
MRDIFLITKERITWGKCKETIKSVFPKAEGSNSFVLIGKSPKTIQIWFDDTESGDRLTDTQQDATDFTDETKKQIPFPNGYVTNVEFHLKKEAAKLVKALETLYPELYIIDDEDNVFSAKDYLIHVEVEGEE